MCRWLGVIISPPPPTPTPPPVNVSSYLTPPSLGLSDFWDIIIIHRFYMALVSALKRTHCAPVRCGSKWGTLSSHVRCGSKWGTLSFHSKYFFISTEMAYWQRSLVVAWLVPRETAAVSAQVLCTPFNRAPVYMSLHLNHIGRVHACLAVTCHLRFWQNDRDLLRATIILLLFLTNFPCTVGCVVTVSRTVCPTGTCT